MALTLSRRTQENGFPTIVVSNHSAKFFANLQRRLKVEPFDPYLFHQSTGEIDEIERVGPALIVIGRRYGFPKNDIDFVTQLRSRSSLETVPILLVLVEPMRVTEELQPGVHSVWIDAGLHNLEPIVAAIHALLDGSSREKTSQPGRIVSDAVRAGNVRTPLASS